MARPAAAGFGLHDRAGSARERTSFGQAARGRVRTAERAGAYPIHLPPLRARRNDVPLLNLLQRELGGGDAVPPPGLERRLLDEAVTAAGGNNVGGVRGAGEPAQHSPFRRFLSRGCAGEVRRIKRQRALAWLTK
jgi:hypothetical protein